jgi:hypothetical protein
MMSRWNGLTHTHTHTHTHTLTHTNTHTHIYANMQGVKTITSNLAMPTRNETPTI